MNGKDDGELDAVSHTRHSWTEGKLMLWPGPVKLDDYVLNRPYFFDVTAYSATRHGR